MDKTGYDPDGMRRFFQRILAAEPGRGRRHSRLPLHAPAVAERIAATKTEMDRIGAPKSVKQDDAKLAADAGPARADASRPTRAARAACTRARSFDATKTDPLLAKAREARIDGNDGCADELLAQAQQAEPGDPRVALERARAWPRSAATWKRARPARARARARPKRPARAVPARLAQRAARQQSRAPRSTWSRRVANFRPKTAARRRAEFELARLEFKLLDESGPRRRRGREPSARQFKPRRPGHLVGRDLAALLPDEPEFQVPLARPEGRGGVQRAACG